MRAFGSCLAVVCFAAAVARAQDGAAATDAPAIDMPVSDAPAPPNDAPPANDDESQNAAPAEGGTAGFAIPSLPRSRLHVGLDAGAGFDTNPFSAPTEQARFVGDALVRIRPRATLNIPGNSLHSNLSASVDYGLLPGAVQPDTRALLLYQAAVSGDVSFDRASAWSFAANDAFSWSTDPGIAVVGSLLSRVTNGLGVGAAFRPGGGALSLKLVGDFTFTKWLDVQNRGGLVAQGVLDSIGTGLTFRTDYRFLPKTGVFSTATTSVQGYPLTNTQSTAYPLSVYAGLQGQILPRIAGMASVGYSNPMIVTDGTLTTGSLFGLAGQLEAQCEVTRNTAVGVGYARDFRPIALYQYVGKDRVYARGNLSLRGRLTLAASASYEILQFGTEETGDSPLTDRPTGRVDGQLDLGLQLGYALNDWVRLTVSDTFAARSTNASDVTDPDVRTNLGYIQNVTLLGLGVWY